jgi:hypothetical protein
MKPAQQQEQRSGLPPERRTPNGRHGGRLADMSLELSEACCWPRAWPGWS